MIVILDYSAHYPNKLIEMTEEEIAKVRELEGRGCLYDTEEGRKLIKELEKRPEVKHDSILVYI